MGLRHPLCTFLIILTLSPFRDTIPEVPLVYQITIAPQVKKVVSHWPLAIQARVRDLIGKLGIGSELRYPSMKPMPEIAPGCRELRFKDRQGQYRVFYLLKQPHGVIVFHAFQKKTKKTPPHEIKVAQARLKAILQEKSHE